MTMTEVGPIEQVLAKLGQTLSNGVRCWQAPCWRFQYSSGIYSSEGTGRRWYSAL